MLYKRDLLTSRQNPTVKQICALSDKKYRRREGLFRFDGIKLLREALSAGLRLRYVVVREDLLPEIEALLCKAESGGRDCGELIPVSLEVFEKISEEKSPEGVLSVAELPSELHRGLTGADCEKYSVCADERMLIAESLRDPGNLGTVIRTCATLGIDRLILSDDCADLYSPKTVRGAMGGIFRLRIDILPTDALGSAILSLREQGRRVYATALHERAERIGEIALSRGDCFVIGNEGHGLSENTVAACDACAIIPMTESSESLNAAAAAAICVWETVRAK